jgi:hypothetical protein
MRKPLSMTTKLDDLADHLHLFEKKYHLPSEEFQRKFRTGEMGDDADMFEWDAFHLMWLSIRERLDALLVSVRPEAGQAR